MHLLRLPQLLSVLLSACLVVACGQAPPSWQKLLAGKITQQFPTYTVQARPAGLLTVQRPGLPDASVDADEIGRFCQRGPKDCGYATEQMLLGLMPP